MTTASVMASMAKGLFAGALRRLKREESFDDSQPGPAPETPSSAKKRPPTSTSRPSTSGKEKPNDSRTKRKTDSTAVHKDKRPRKETQKPSEENKQKGLVKKGNGAPKGQKDQVKSGKSKDLVKPDKPKPAQKGKGQGEGPSKGHVIRTIDKSKHLRLHLDLAQRLRKAKLAPGQIFRKGDRVEYHSVTENKWIQATVTGLLPDGLLGPMCSIDSRPGPVYLSRLRPPRPPTATVPEAVAAAPPRFKEGDRVEYHSVSEDTWISATITRVLPDGPLGPMCRIDARELPVRMSRMRPPRQSTAASSGGRPQASTAGQPSFRQGDRVEYHSVSEDTWIPATITGLLPDGPLGPMCNIDARPGSVLMSRMRRLEPSPLAEVMHERYRTAKTLLQVLKKTPLDAALRKWLATKGTEVGTRILRDPDYIGKGLTKEELGALHVYTLDAMEEGGRKLYIELNQALDGWDTSPELLEKYLPLVQLLIRAYEKLGGKPWKKLYRSESRDYSLAYTPGQEITWWSFKSTSRTAKTVKDFLGKEGGNTIFHIDAKRALWIEKLSAHKEEHEVLLVPGTRVKVTRMTTSQENKDLKDVAVCEVWVEEIDPFPYRWESSK